MADLMSNSSGRWASNTGTIRFIVIRLASVAHGLSKRAGLLLWATAMRFSNRLAAGIIQFFESNRIPKRGFLGKRRPIAPERRHKRAHRR